MINNDNELEIKKNWVNCPANFSKEELLINNYQVMQRWEENYMKELVDVATRNSGKILEVGFGMGISAGYIQKSNKFSTHTIIEAHPGVISYAANKYKDEIAKGKMILINGFWENVVDMLKEDYYDGILFDTGPIDRETFFYHFFPFFKHAYKLLKKGGMFSYFSDEAVEFSIEHMEKLKEAGFVNIDSKICKINPPKDCRYWTNNTILIPIIYK
ncbi:MAG: hypothetical protein NT116_00900 [Candidatus Parcubacteria bacterium]|nr:hypothetical protein [Candidatus Parcubacteria bacterium]